jgi:Tol biopolymer transport system component
MNSDGSDQKKITDLSVRCEKPVVSHSGKTVLFVHYSEDFFYELYSIDIDGTNLSLLDRAERYCGSPDWSKDDTKIVYSKNRDESSEDKDIMLMDIVSGETQSLTASGNNTDARFSPDNRITYCKEMESDTIFAFSCRWDMYIMDVNGSGNQLIVREACNPVWSPDGSKIAYISTDASSSPQISTINPDGSNPRQLTSASLPSWDSGFPPFGNYDPHWTPDGRRIVYVSEINEGLPEIYIMNRDGSDQTRLTDTERRNENPEISCDGKWIYFSSNRILEMQAEIFIMNLHGKYQEALSNYTGDDIFPVEITQ